MPTRPVVGAAGIKLSSISTMVDKILQPLLSRLPTYCLNSNQVIYQLSDILKKIKLTTNSTTRCYLVTVDAVSMQTNMIKDKIITKMRKLLNEKIMCVNNKILIEEIMEALTIILENIFFLSETLSGTNYEACPWTPLLLA